MAHQLLLADDSVTIQRVIKLTFADEDVDVVTVGDGNEAVASIDRQPPDIVLADVAMPGRSGYEVAQHIRTSPRLAHIPVLLLTGAFEPVDEARATEVGCDGVLAKPFEPEVVVSRVKALLAKPRTMAAAVLTAPEPVAIAVAAGAADAPGPGPTQMFPAMPGPALAAEPAPESSPKSDPSDVDAYFERLDQAFATLALTPRVAQPASELLESVTGPVSEVPPVEAGPAVLADAFGGLTTPELPPPASASAALPCAPPNPAERADLTDAQLEMIVGRVIDALTARLGVHLSDIVATVAERVVREEIAEIKRRT